MCWWCPDFEWGREIRWVLCAFKGAFSCHAGLVVRATIQADGSLNFCGFSDGDRDVVDLNILQTAKIWVPHREHKHFQFVWKSKGRDTQWRPPAVTWTRLGVKNIIRKSQRDAKDPPTWLLPDSTYLTAPWLRPPGCSLTPPTWLLPDSLPVVHTTKLSFAFREGTSQPESIDNNS